jgi:hypothetical protein
LENTKKIPKKPYFKKIQEKFEVSLMPELENRKNVLATMRSFNKPINRIEIEEHRKKIDDIVK